MEKSSKIYVAGHTGLVGSAITSTLTGKGYNNLVTRHHNELDLANQRAVDDFFAVERPDYVFLAAANVGGIVANNTYRADFIYQNIMIQSNVIHACWKNDVKKLLFLGSICVYPKNAPQPMKEEYLLTSPLEETNEPYAVAKIAGLKMCESFNRQYGTNFISVMPTNIYGPGDKFNLERSHVLPALLRKIHLGRCLEQGDWRSIRKDLSKNPIEKVDGDAGEEEILQILQRYGVLFERAGKGDKLSGRVSVTIWGTGTPMRELMYSLDMAEACVYVVENVDVNDIVSLSSNDDQSENHPPHFLNIGTGEEITISALAYKIKELTGFQGEIVFDTSKPDGPLRKVANAASLHKLGFMHKYDLNTGLLNTYHHYVR